MAFKYVQQIEQDCGAESPRISRQNKCVEDTNGKGMRHL